MADWIFGIFAGLCALMGLFLASGALDVGMATFGFALFAFGCFLVFFLMKQHFDAEDSRRAAARRQ